MKLKNEPKPPDSLPDNGNGGGGGGGGSTPSEHKTWWQRNWIPVVGIGSIVLIIGIVLLFALL